MKQKTPLLERWKRSCFWKKRGRFLAEAKTQITSRLNGGLLPLFPLPAAMKEDKAQRKEAKHNCAFFWFKDDGAARKAMRTAKSIQPIPISAETSRLQVTQP